MAAKSANVNRNTIYYWLTDPQFVDAVEEAAKELAVQAANIIRKQLFKNNDVATAKWYLERALPQMFSKEAIAEQEKEKALTVDSEERSITFAPIEMATPDKSRNELD